MVDEHKWALNDRIWILYFSYITFTYILPFRISFVIIHTSHVDWISLRPVMDEEEDLSLLSILVFSFGIFVGKYNPR